MINFKTNSPIVEPIKLVIQIYIYSLYCMVFPVKSYFNETKMEKNKNLNMHLST